MNTNSTNETIKKVIKQLSLVYYGFYALAVALATLAYLMVGEYLAYSEPGTIETVLKSVYILFLICSIPLVLKLFNLKVKKLSEIESLEEKIKKYRNYSLFRLLVIGVNLLLGVGFFYFLSSKSMLFCAGIAAIALVFCKPTVGKMESELEMDEEE